MRDKTTVQVCLYVDRDLHKRAKEIRDRLGVSFTRIVAEGLKAQLARYEPLLKADKASQG